MNPPAYVDYGGLSSAPGPLRCEGAVLYAFLADARRRALNDLCGRVIEAPSGGSIRCSPLLADRVLITFGVIASIRCESPPYDRMGYLTERHAAIWIPVVCRGPRGTPRIAVLIPAMWLDDPLSIVSGREAYGYAKHWGWPRFEGDGTGTEPPGAGAPRRFDLDAYAIETYDGTGTPARHPLLSLERETDGEADGPERAGDLRALAADIVGGCGGDSALARELESLSQGSAMTVDQLFLRQFRAPGGGLAASGSEVVTAPADIVPGTLRWRLLAAHRLSVAALDSHPLDRELGLASQRAWPALRVSFDFRVGGGRVLGPPGSA